MWVKKHFYSQISGTGTFLHTKSWNRNNSTHKIIGHETVLFTNILGKKSFYSQISGPRNKSSQISGPRNSLTHKYLPRRNSFTRKYFPQNQLNIRLKRTSSKGRRCRQKDLLNRKVCLQELLRCPSAERKRFRETKSTSGYHRRPLS